MLSLAVGAVDTSLDIQIVDDEGLPVTGLVASTMPTLKFSKGVGADVTITLTDLALLTTVHADGGVKERGEGVYRLDVPDTVCSTAAIVKLRAESTGKRMICPPVQVGLQDALVAALEAVVEDISGFGARTVTITVNDGSSPLSSARVRVTQGLFSYSQFTNASGVATFNLDDSTWQIAITATGYSFAGASLVVNGDETQTYSMTAVSVTPPTNPSLSAIEVLCVDKAGQPESDVDVDIRIFAIPSGSQNIAFEGAKQTATSDGDGIARFEVVQGGTYEWKRGLADAWTRVTIDADGVTNVTSVIGSP